MYPDIDSCDQIKTLNNLFEPDPRTHLLGLKIEKYVSLMKQAQISNLVPRVIRAQFDMARNIFIFSYYSYQMGMAAQVQAFACLELALRMRLADSTNNSLNERASLSELFRYALENDWINDLALPPDTVDLKRSAGDNKYWCKTLKNYWAPSMQMRRQFGYKGRRNQLIHEPGSLDLPYESAEVLRKCAYIINYLFRGFAKEPASAGN